MSQWNKAKPKKQCTCPESSVEAQARRMRLINCPRDFRCGVCLGLLPLVVAPIFELRDVTQDGVYYTQGFFMSLDSAIAAVELPGPPPLEEGSDDYEVVSLEIRKHNMGFTGGHGDLLWSRSYEHHYDEEIDDEVWTVC